jgi:ABC-type nitrate/sulfonate/bicarbonate transport system permease component
LNVTLARIGVVAAFLALWEIGARLFGDPLFICPPSAVVGGIGTVLHTPGVVGALFAVFWELVIGFLIAVVAGTAVGLVLGLNRFWYGALFPIVLMLYAIPQTTVLPLFILMFGVGAKAKIIFGVAHSVFVVVITTVAGARNIDAVLVQAARSMGASRRQMIAQVVFPSIVPSLFTGMRLAMAGTLLGVLLAELYVSTAGVGAYTTQFSSAFQPQNLLGLIALLATMAVILNGLCSLAERRFSRWKA